MTKQNTDDKIKTQSITISTIIGKAIEAIVAYVVLWFFEPVWKKIVKWWKGENESDN